MYIMKQFMSAMMIGAALLSAAGCSDETASSNESKDTAQAVSSAEAASSGNNKAGGKALVVYFSFSENADLPDGADASSRASIKPTADGIIGNTGVIARMIQKDTNADIVSLKTVDKYPADYDATVNQAKEELQSGARPALATKIDNIADYDTIFVGYPNWWSDMPMPLYTFFDEYDLSGKKIVPFITHGGSGLSDTVTAIKDLEPNAEVAEGFAEAGSNVDNAQGDVDTWLKSLGYLK